MFILLMAHGHGCSVLLIEASYASISLVVCRSTEFTSLHPKIWDAAYSWVFRHNTLCLQRPEEAALVKALWGLSGLEKMKVFVLHFCTCNYTLYKPLLPVASPKTTSRLTHAGQQILKFSL